MKIKQNKQTRAQHIVDRLAHEFNIATVAVETNGSLPRSVVGLYHHPTHSGFKSTNTTRTNFVWFVGRAPKIEIRPRSDLDTILHEFAHHLVAAWGLKQPDCHGYIFWQVFDEVKTVFRALPDYVELCDTY